MKSVELENVSLAAIELLADAMTRTLPVPLVVGLVGTLGAGKTTFVQKVAAAAGVDSTDVTSPTFTLLSSYPATLQSREITLHHMDVYRVADEEEFLELGAEELFEDSDAWTLIEWADKVQTMMPPSTLWIQIEFSSDTSPSCPSSDRVVRFSTSDDRLDTALQAMRRDFERHRLDRDE